MDIQYEIIDPKNLSQTDWEELTVLTHASFKEHAERGLSMLSVSCSADFLKKRCLNGKLILASCNGQPAGYCCFAIQTSENKKILKFTTIAVHPHFKRMGISKQLHTLTIEQARLNHCDVSS